jgi:outer membrane lipoprotein-sorting protein
MGFLAMLASGCALRGPSSGQTAAATQAGAELAQHDKMISSLQTSAIMEYRGAGEHLKVRERIVARRPASVRVEVMSPVGVALVLAADGGQVAIFDPSRNTLMRGPATAATLNRYARIPMPPQAAVRMLMGLTPDSSMLAFAPDEFGVLPDNSRYLLYRQPNGTTDYLTIDATGNLTDLRQTLASGRESYEVKYGDYRAGGPDGSIMFPMEVAASFPMTGASVKFRYSQPVLDGEIDDTTFMLSPGEDTRRITIGMLGSAAPRAD